VVPACLPELEAEIQLYQNYTVMVSMNVATTLENYSGTDRERNFDVQACRSGVTRRQFLALAFPPCNYLSEA
jgi:hypothetical protein